MSDMYVKYSMIKYTYRYWLVFYEGQLKILTSLIV